MLKKYTAVEVLELEKVVPEGLIFVTEETEDDIEEKIMRRKWSLEV